MLFCTAGTDQPPHSLPPPSFQGGRGGAPQLKEHARRGVASARTFQIQVDGPCGFLARMYLARAGAETKKALRGPGGGGGG